MVVLGAAYVNKQLETANWLEARAEHLNKNVELVRAAVKDAPSADLGFREACAKMRFQRGKEPMGITLARTGADSRLHLAKKESGPNDGPFDLASGPLLKDGDELSSLPYGLEGALKPEVFVVPSQGQVRPSSQKGKNEWAGTMTAFKPDSGERCSGKLVVTIYDSAPTDQDLVYAVLNEASWN